MSGEFERASAQEARRPGAATVRRRWRERGLLLLLVAVCFAVYRASPVRTVSDPYFTVLTSESLLTRGSWDLSPYLAQLVEAARRRGEQLAAPADGSSDSTSPGFSRRNYQLRRRGDALLYFYPPGVPLLAVPLVAVTRLAGLSAIDEQGRYQFSRELEIHAWLGALVAAVAAGVLFRLARRELPAGPALGVALAAAFGTSLWSSASGALWTHTWTVPILALALLELLRWEDGEERRPLWLGALMVAAVWVRPTSAIAAAATAIFVAARHRAALFRLLVTGALGLLAFVAWSEIVWGAPVPLYYRLGQRAALEGFPSAFLGLLMSPSRGLLVFSPMLAWVALVLARYGVPAARRPLALLAVAVAGLQVALYATWPYWWGGGSYGPRLLTDLVPYFAWFGALAVAAVVERSRSGALTRPVRRALAIGALLLTGLSFAVHGAGVASRSIQRAVVGAGGGRAWSVRSSPYAAIWAFAQAPAEGEREAPSGSPPQGVE
ncbi:MAG: hypothetical protein F9K18_05700 [Thermoanaerobaculia bacterium]|nr:MAG: hypothetical protein F9K18_05700 [Thermoanaerobaculia bacterium]